VSAASDRHLNLWKQQLGRVPESVWDHLDLETLVLADNGLTEISERIGALKKLRMLDLGHNLLARVPDALGDLDGLTDFLYLHDNRLTGLPDSMAQLTRLRYLNISDNALTALPAPVCAMTGLRELRASGNRLTSLPIDIRRLSRLRELHLRDNQLTALPDAVGDLHELRQIDLRGNRLTMLPDRLASLPRLEKLDLRWVTRLTPPPWFDDLESRGCVVYR
jgi:Leucine-rich repeat (LRR) protein